MQISKNRVKNALKLAGGTAASFLLFSSGKVWAQCASTPPDALVVTGTCSESDAVRSTSGDNQRVVLVEPGATYIADNMTITSTGNHAYGLNAEAGSTVNIENVDIVTEGFGSDALLAKGTGTTVKFDRVSFRTTGGSARGIRAMNGAIVEGAKATIRTWQPTREPDQEPGYMSSFAILVEDNNSKVSLTDSEILVEGEELSVGVYAREEGEFQGNRLDIITSGPDVWGGAVGDPGSKFTLIESYISTDAEDSRGLVATKSGIMVLDRVGVATAGTDAHGIRAATSAVVEARNITIETQGSGAIGTFISNVDTSVTIDGGNIRTSGNLAHAFHIEDGGTLTASNVHASAAGAGASAIALTRPTSNDVANITINGGSLAATDGSLIKVDGGHGTITINGSTNLAPGLVGGRRVLASVNGSGTGSADINFRFNGVAGITGDLITTGSDNSVNAALTSSDWVGDLSVAANNTMHLGLAGSQWSGRSTGATAIDLDAASTWNVTDSSTSGTVTNAGLVRFSSNSPGFSTLTVRDYSGQDGTLGINTVLDADNSPSNRLVIDGGIASGNTGVVVTNAGGIGALTTGDGIRVVETLNGGSTMDGAFHLSARAAAGAYEYMLFRGGSISAEDWFLRSHLIEQPQEQPQDTEVIVPLYRPEVPLYTPAPAMARQMGLSFLGTLHERVGEQMNVRPQADQKNHVNGAWGRVIGEHGNSKWSGTAKTRARDANIVGIQAGLDIYRAEHANGYRDHAGIYGGYIRHSAKIRGFALGVNNLQAGKLTLDGPAVGAYWTRYSPSGTYLDGVVQWNWFDVTAKSNYGTRMDTKGTGFAASLEVGHPIAMGDGWQIEPQAQLIYQNISIRKTSDAFSTVKWREGDAVTGRLGARLQFTSEHGDTLWQPYAKANIWHGFSGKDRTVFGANTMANKFGNTALELGAGVTAKVSKTVSLYAHLDHRWSLSGRESGAFTGGAVGVRVNW